MEQSRYLQASCSNVANGHWPCTRTRYVLSRNFCKWMQRITVYLVVMMMVGSASGLARKIELSLHSLDTYIYICGNYLIDQARETSEDTRCYQFDDPITYIPHGRSLNLLLFVDDDCKRRRITAASTRCSKTLPHHPHQNFRPKLHLSICIV